MKTSLNSRRRSQRATCRSASGTQRGVRPAALNRFPEGLEERLMLASDLTIDGTAAKDVLVISQPAAGQLRVILNGSSSDYTLPSGPDARIEINGLTLSDTVNFQGAIDLTGIDLHVQAEEITVESSASIRADNITLLGRGQDGGLSVVDNLPFSLTLTERQVTVEPGAELIAANDIELSAVRNASLISSYRTLGGSNKTARITLDGARLNAGNNVLISANTEDKALLDEAPAWANNFLIGPVSRFIFDGIFPSVPVGVMIRDSQSTITLSDVQIDAGADVTVNALSAVDASTWAIAMDLDGVNDNGIVAKVLNRIAAGYSQANSDARIDLLGTSSIVAGGNVDMAAESGAVAGVSATTRLNTGQPDAGQSADSKAFGFSFAVSMSETIAKTYVGPKATIDAVGNVNVNAIGSSGNSAAAGVSIFVDGTAGVGVSFGSDFADVTSVVDGTITSQQGAPTTIALPIQNIKQADNTIFLPGHGLKTGEVLMYLSQDPSDDEQTDLLDIGGLVSGLEYRVIVVDDDHIQLATSETLPLDARGTDPNSIHRLALQQVVEFNPAASVDLDNDRIQLSAPGLAEGAMVSYGAAHSSVVNSLSPIGGLANNQIYVAINVVPNGGSTSFQLAELSSPTTPIDLTSVGTGDSHLIGYTQTSSMAIPFSPSVAVDREAGTIHLPSHGLQSGDAVTYQTDASVERRRVVERSTFLYAPSQIELLPEDVDVQADAIRPTSGHDLVTGQPVIFRAQGSSVAGLTDGQTYYAIRDPASLAFQLASTASDAVNNRPIALNAAPSGNVAFEIQTVEGDVMYAANHGFETGQQVRYIAGQGAESFGLVNGQAYFAIRVDDARFKLAASLPQAQSDQAISLSGTLQGNLHERLTTDTVVQLFDAALDKPVVDAQNEVLTIPHHQLVDGTRVIYRPAGVALGGLVDGGEYVIRVIDAQSVQLLSPSDASVVGFDAPTMFGAGRHALIVVHPDVDLTTDTFYLGDHGLEEGQVVTYYSDGQPAIGGLTDGADYEVIRVNGDDLQLRQIGQTNPISLTAGATVDHVHRLVTESADELLFTPNLIAPARSITSALFDADAVPALDLNNNTIRIVDHQFAEGETVRYLHPGGPNVGGLTNGAEYRVHVVDDAHIQLRNPGSLATIDLTSRPTGLRHGLERQSLVTSFDAPIFGLRSEEVYYVVVLDADTIQLASSPEDAAGATAIVLDRTTVEKPLTEVHQFKTTATSGIGVTADLAAASESTAAVGLGGAPKFADLIYKGEVQSPFSLVAPGSFTKSKFNANAQKGILNNNAKDVLRGESGSENDTFSAAAALAIALANHTVLAMAGGNAKLTASEDVAILSSLEQAVTLKGEGSVSSDDGGRSNGVSNRNKDKKAAVSAGVVIGVFDNQVQSIVDSGVKINAGELVSVASALNYPLAIDPIALGPFGGYYTPRQNAPEDVDFLKEVTTLIGGKLGLDRIVNVWANTRNVGSGTQSGNSAKVSVAGSIAFTDYNNVSEAIVREGALINQDASLRTLNQAIDVTADLSIDMVSVAGMIALGLNVEGVRNAHKARTGGKPFMSNIFSLIGNTADQVGIGGSLLITNYQNQTRAIVEDGVRLYAADDEATQVLATESVFTFDFVQSGGSSGKLGISGSVAVTDQNSTTLAQIAPAATVETGRLVVDADNATTHIALVGAIQTAKAVGIGATISLQFLERNTQAVVGSQSIRFGKNAARNDKRLRLFGHGLQTGDRVVYRAVEGAAATGLSDGGEYYVHRVDPHQIQLYPSRDLAFAGDENDAITIGTLADDSEHSLERLADLRETVAVTPAAISALGVFGLAGHGLRTGDRVIYQTGAPPLAGMAIGRKYYVTRIDSGSFYLSESEADAQSETYLLPTHTNQASIHRLIHVGQEHVIPADDVLTLSTLRSRAHGLQTGDLVRLKSRIGSLGIGDYFVIRLDGNRIRLASTLENALAGTAVIFPPGNPTRFEQIGSIQTRDVQVEATNGGNVINIGAAAAIVSNTKSGDAASQDPASAANAGSGSGGSLAGISSVSQGITENTTGRKSGVAIAGIATWNQIDDTTVAQMNRGVRVTLSSPGIATVHAENSTSIYGLAGALSIAKADDTAIGIAGAFSRNLLRHDTRSGLDDVRSNGANRFEVTANHSGTIGGLTIGVAGSKTTPGAGKEKKKGVALGGSVSWNTIDARTLATVHDSAISTPGDVSVRADDTSRMVVIGGGAGVALGGQLGFGAGVAVNGINTDTRALVTDSFVTSHTFEVTADNRPTIISIAVAAGVGQIGIAGMLALNSVHPKTHAEVIDSHLNIGTVVTVSAKDHSEIYSDGGGVAVGIKKAKAGDDQGAIAAAFGIGVAINEIGTKDDSGTFARMIETQVISQVDVSIIAESHAYIQALALAGSVAVANQSGSQGGSTAIAGAGAATRNVIATKIVAESQQTQFNSAGTVIIHALDAAQIDGDAGGVAISASLNSGSGGSNAVGVGIGVAINDIFTETVAGLSGQVSNIDSLDIAATAAPPPGEEYSIRALAIGGSLAVGIGKGDGQAGAFSGAGAITRNRISRSIDAFIEDATIMGREVSVVALDNSVIHADAGGVAIAVSAALGSGTSASATISASVARNHIEDFGNGGGSVMARIDRSTINANERVAVTATATPTIDALSIAGSISVGVSTGSTGITGAGAGADSRNHIAQTIQASIIDSTVTTQGDLDVLTNTSAHIRSVVVGAAVGVSVGAGSTGASLTIGASVANNFIDNQSSAFIRSSTVDATNQVDVQALSQPKLLDTLTNELTDAELAAGPLSRELLAMLGVVDLVTTLEELVTVQADDEETEDDEYLADTLIVDPVLLRILTSKLEGIGISVSKKTVVTHLDEGRGWMVVDTIRNKAYEILRQLDGRLAVSSVNIQAVSAAASVSVSVGNTGVSLSGGGASSRNVITSDNEAFLDQTDLTASGVLVEAVTSNGIIATVVAAAVGVGVGLSGTAVSAAIGAALVQNSIGYDENNQRDPASARAYIAGGTTEVAGTLDVSALTAQSIKSVVFAGSVAVSAAPAGGSIGLSGSGASAINRIAADADASLRDIDRNHISAGTLWVDADDTSLVHATAGAVAVAVAASSDFAAGLSIGVGLARNTITSEITATIDNVYLVRDATSQIGQMFVIAEGAAVIEAVAFAASVAVGASGVAGLAISGAGAESTNVIQTQVLATIDDSLIDLQDQATIRVRALDSSRIDAKIVSIAVSVGAGAAGGIGASIGVALARNFIGYDPDTTVAADYDTSDNPATIRAPRGNQPGDVIRIVSGVRGGDVYEYIGSEDLERPDLGESAIADQIKWLAMLDYGDASKWRQLNLLESPSRTQASITATRLAANTVDLAATSRQSITSGAGAGSAAVSAGSAVGGSLSGAGVGAHNKIHNDVRAFYDQSGASKFLTGVANVRNFSINATDDSTIDTTAAAASLAGAFSGGLSIAISIGASIAKNEIENVVQAYMAGANFPANDQATFHVEAKETSRIDALSGAVSVAVGVGFPGIGIALSGAGANAINRINNGVEAFITDSELNAAAVSVIASNTASIDATVFAVAAAVSGGTLAGAGSIGASIARNLIGRDTPDGTSHQNHTWAYIADSNIIAKNDVTVRATSNETITTVSAAGSAAIAIGFGVSVAGSGAEATSVIATETHAWLDNAFLEMTAPGARLNVDAVGNSRIDKAKAIGASLAGSLLGSIAISASLVDNDVDNDIRAQIIGAGSFIITPGDIIVSARSNETRIEEVEAVSAAIAVGAFAASGGGVDIRNDVTNQISSSIDGAARVIARSVDVTAHDKVTISAEATVASIAIGFSAAVGVALVSNRIGGSTEAYVSDTSIIANNVSIVSTIDPTIQETTTVGVSGATLAGQGNRSLGEVTTQNRAFASNTQFLVTDDLEVLATTNNWIRTTADGGAFGAIATAAMRSDIVLGANLLEADTLAAIGDRSTIQANRVVVSAISDDSMRSEAVAGGAALAAAIGADASITSHQAVKARIGANVDITATHFELVADHRHDFDAKADSFSVAAGSGSGASVRNKILGGAIAEVGSGSSVQASTIDIDAQNHLEKSRYWGSANLLSGSYGLLNTSVVTSKTELGQSSAPGETLDALVTVNNSASLLATDFGGTIPTRLRIQAYNNAELKDTAKVEGGAGLAVTTAISDISTFTNAAVRLSGASVINEDGDVHVTANTDTDVRSRAELLVFQISGGGGADPRSRIHATNHIEAERAIVQGEDIFFWSGRRLASTDSAAPSSAILVALTDSNITTVSLGLAINIAAPSPTIEVENLISVVDGTRVEAYEDVNLIADRMNVLEPIADASGLVVNVSLIPYGYKINDNGVRVVVNADVNFGDQVSVVGGIFAQAAAIIEPVMRSGVRQIQDTDFGQPISAAHRQQYGLGSQAEYVYGRLELERIAFSVSRAMAIRVAPGHTAGGTPGTIYRYIGSADEILIFPESENYLNSSRWTSNLTQNERDRLAIYDSDITVAFANEFQDKFFVIRNRELPDFAISLQNIGNKLARQRSEILDWISNHSSNLEAVARYQEQLAAIDAQLVAMGLTETITLTDGLGNVTGIETLVVPDFDTFLIDIPEIYSAPGSVLIESKTTNASDAIALNDLRGSEVASIKIINRSPFLLNVNDLTIADNRRVVNADGEIKTLSPGNVYLNFEPLTQNVGQTNAITIVSGGYNAAVYDLGSFTIPDVPQDLYVSGDVQNLNGTLSIQNSRGGISVSGELRAATVNIQANGDFNLNTDGWLHTNQDPRQYLQWSDQYGHLMSNPSSTLGHLATDLRNAINRDESQIVSRGNINITARFLNINGLIQSGATEYSLTISDSFVPSVSGSLIDDNGNPVAGVSFGASGIPLDAYFDWNQQAIVVPEIRATGGEIRLAGQIFSTGNGRLRVANGFTQVDIDNRSDYKTIVEGADITTPRVGRITIVDTDLLTKTEYVAQGFGYFQSSYQGAPGTTTIDGRTVTSINYTRISGPLAVLGDGQYVPGRPDQHPFAASGSPRTYVWLEGQEAVSETINIYQHNGFNIIGVRYGDALVEDQNLVEGPKVTLVDDQPLLISETLVDQPLANETLLASASYRRDVLVDDVTTIYDFPEKYGWLRKFTVTATTTERTGYRDMYEFRLKADYPIGIQFRTNADTPRINIQSKGDLLLKGDLVNFDDGQTHLTTSQGDILGDSATVVYGRTPVVDAAGAVKLNIEGDKGPANIVGRRGNTVITAVSKDNQSSSLLVQQVVGANAVVIVAPHGITSSLAVDATTPAIQARRIELSASEGNIGTFDQAVTIDAGNQANAGLVAYANLLVNLRDTHGNLRLTQPRELPAELQNSSSVKAIIVRLTSDAGNIIDAWTEAATGPTAEELNELDQRLALSGQAAEAAAENSIRNDERRVTELYHDYWRDVRALTFSGFNGTLPIATIANDMIGFDRPHGLSNGAELRVSFGIDLSQISTTQPDWTVAEDHRFDEASVHLEPLDTVLAQDGFLYQYLGDDRMGVDLSAESYDDASLWRRTPFRDLIGSSPELTVVSPGQIVRIAANQYARYTGAVRTTLPNVAVGLSYFAVVVDDHHIYLHSGRFDAAKGDVAGRIALGSLVPAQVVLQTPSYAHNNYGDVDESVLPQHFRDLHSSLGPADSYQSGYAYELPAAERQARIAERTLDRDRLAFPLTVAMLTTLYPGVPLESNVVVTPVTLENPNIDADNVTLYANSGNGNVGNVQAARTLNLSNGFASLSDADKSLLASSDVNDIAGIHFDLYRYQGPAGIVDAAQVNSSATFTRIPITYRTSNLPTIQTLFGPITPPVAVITGQTVLVERADQYGLYEYIGPTSVFLLQNETFAGNPTRWRLLTPKYNSADGPVSLLPGDLVADVTTPRFVMIRPTNDINVRTDVLNAEATEGVYVESDRELAIGKIVGRDVTLTTTEALKAFDVAISATGDVSLRAATIRSFWSPNSPFVVNLGTDATLRAEATGKILIQQTDTVPASELNLLSVSSNDDIVVTVPRGNLNVGWINTSNNVTLQAPEGVITDALDIELADSEQINVFAHNLTVSARDHIGANSMGNADALNVELTGSLTSTTAGNIFFESVKPLRVNTIRSQNVTIGAKGELHVGSIQASQGVVTLTSEAAILNDLVLTGVNDPTNVSYFALQFQAPIVGSPSKPLSLDGRGRFQFLPSVTGQAEQGIYLWHQNGPMYVGSLTSTGGTIDILADQSLLALVPPPNAGDMFAHLHAPHVKLTSSSIGSSTQPLILQADTLTTHTTQDQYLLERDHVDAVEMQAGTAQIILVGGNFGLGDVTGTVVAQSGATASGIGQVVGTLVLAGGVVAPGLSPGVLQASSAQWTSGVVRLEIGGALPGNGAGFHDQLLIDDQLTIDPQTSLELSLVDGYLPPSASRFTLIKNDGVGALVAGNFLNLPEGATLLLGGVEYVITYAGNDGNDVVIYQANPVFLKVHAWIVDSSSWSDLFRDYIDGGFNDGPSGGTLDDSIAEGFRVTDSLSTIPWIGVDRIKIQFDGDVGSSLDTNDFALTGHSGFRSDFTASPVPEILSVDWDATSRTATVNLKEAIQASAIDLRVLAAGVHDTLGSSLEQDATMRIVFVPGDARDLSNGGPDFAVNGSDLSFVRQHLSGFIYDEPGNNSFDAAFDNYDPRADVNGDGFVNGSDRTEIRRRLSSFVYLPPTAPSLAAEFPSIRPRESSAASSTAEQPLRSPAVDRVVTALRSLVQLDLNWRSQAVATLDSSTTADRMSRATHDRSVDQALANWNPTGTAII